MTKRRRSRSWINQGDWKPAPLFQALGSGLLLVAWFLDWNLVQKRNLELTNLNENIGQAIQASRFSETLFAVYATSTMAQFHQPDTAAVEDWETPWREAWRFPDLRRFWAEEIAAKLRQLKYTQNVIRDADLSSTEAPIGDILSSLRLIDDKMERFEKHFLSKFNDDRLVAEALNSTPRRTTPTFQDVPPITHVIIPPPDASRLSCDEAVGAQRNLLGVEDSQAEIISVIRSNLNLTANAMSRRYHIAYFVGGFFLIGAYLLEARNKK